MEPDAFEDKILTEKKARFLATVKKTAEFLNVEIPRVEFHEDRCPYEGPDEWAHIHIETGIICVSKRRLKQMTFEEIEEAASHEVTHLVNPSHESSFYATQSNARLGTWKPPGGIYLGGGLNLDKENEKIVKKKLNKHECSYYYCKKKTELKKCSYCKQFFCTFHLRPKPAGPPRFKSNRPEDKIFMEEWRKMGGHPCPDFVEYWEAEQKRKQEEYRKKLDLVIKSPRKETPSKAPAKSLEAKLETETKKETEETKIKPDEKEEIKSENKKPNVKKKKIILRLIKIFLPIILIFIIILYLTFSTTTQEVTENLTKIRTVYENQTITSHMSFSKYLANRTAYNNQPVTLKGFLQRYVKGSSTSGVYVQAIADDDGNTLDFINRESEYSSFFLNKGTSPDIYEITGVFKRSYNDLKINVSSIKKSERDISGTILVQKNFSYIEVINYSVKQPRFLIVRNFVFNLFGEEITCSDGTQLNDCSSNPPFFCSYSGLKKDAVKCGCPGGQREYQKECIVIIKCSDNTLSPECSLNKPKQCINGTLINNADECGCPEDYRKDGNSCKKIMRCSDRTEYGQCNDNKPYYCKEGELIPFAEKCGCKWGYSIWKGDCIESKKVQDLEAFDYINQLREENGKNEIDWDERAYKLAVARSKDLTERNYFDHVTPEGTCVKDMKSEYGFSENEILAENLGGMTYYESGEPIAGTSPKEAVDSWMTSRGHRYNLLYEHKSGAIGCYQHICAFIGVHNNPYGLGAGPCTTGAEGLAFWQTIGEQPGEV